MVNISIKIKYGSFIEVTDSFTLTVRKQWIWVDGYDSTELTIGDTVNLIADIGTYDGDNKTVIWTTSDKGIATVNSSGVVTAVDIGEVTITATLEKYPDVSWPVVFEVKLPNSADIEITNVSEKLKLNVGQTFSLEYEITPSEISNQEVAWTVDDEDIAEITSNGKVITHKAGNTKIRVFIDKDRSVYDTIDLSVCLTQKSYIFYNTYDSQNVENSNPEQWLYLVKRDQQNIAYNYYGGNKNMIELIPIENATKFKEEWSSMESNLGYVVISCHASALGLIDFNGNNNDTSDLLNDEIKELNHKTMKGLILECCNAGHLDHIDTGNVATSFASIVNGAPIMASDGTVFFNSLGTDGYENRFSSKRR